MALSFQLHVLFVTTQENILTFADVFVRRIHFQNFVLELYSDFVCADALIVTLLLSTYQVQHQFIAACKLIC